MSANGEIAMTDREKAMRWLRPEYLPVGVGILPSAWLKYRDELQMIVARHPVIFGSGGGGTDYDAMAGGTYVEGRHTDAWGCVWSNVHTGREAIVTGHPLPRREDVRALKAPELDAGLPHGFMFLRLSDLRGFEEIMIDFAEEPPELQMLIDIVLEYNMRQLEIRLGQETQPTLLYFGDDLGIQRSLPISPAKWRTYLKPCYAKLYRRCREAGHDIYMHSDGHIYEIIPDLVECGVDVINAQTGANGLDNLARVCKGKVCVDLDLDRQMFPFFKPEDIDEHVRLAVEALGSPEGGLWLRAEVDDSVPLENIDAIFCALEKYRGYFSGQ